MNKIPHRNHPNTQKQGKRTNLGNVQGNEKKYKLKYRK